MITKQPYSALVVHKINQAKAGIRLKYYKILGMQVKAGSKLGKIKCQWPSRVILGNKCDLEDGVSFKIAHPFSTENYVQMGDGVFVGQGCEFNCSTKIIIGNDCLIASNTTFVDAGREISNLNLNINEQPCVFGEITVGDDVWIGTHSIILRGVSIGKGSVIGAGSVVNKSVPAYQVWAGAPARFIKNR